ncbi:MAG: hypothetical protein Q9160_002661 [Pyrenula sp. 1 TL-2023]
MDPSQVKIPPLMNLSADTITPNTILINSQNEDIRMKYVMERLVTHLHDFARETRLSTNEWMAGIQFLTEVGKICSETRQEFILLSDILGLSLLVDSIDHPKPPLSTEGTVLGPFHTHDAHILPQGSQISSPEADPGGEPCLVLCTVRSSSGTPLADVKIDIWETDSTGHYDVQRPGREEPDGRAVMKTDEQGRFWFKGIKPVPYPIPHDGPVGKLLMRLKRHPFRPSHVHFMFEKEGFDHLITALYLRHDPYETSDAVFGVKDSLLVDLGRVSAQQASGYDIKEGSWLLEYDFVLVTEKESAELREQKSRQALEGLGRKCKFVDGLPVPEVD